MHPPIPEHQRGRLIAKAEHRDGNVADRLCNHVYDVFAAAAALFASLAKVVDFCVILLRKAL
jgi:hypothetical protein